MMFRSVYTALILTMMPLQAYGESDPPEVTIGERLFKDQRLSRPSDLTGDDNLALRFSCASCHLVDQELQTPGKGMRAYNDFEVFSPVPAHPRDDLKATARHTPMMVDVLTHPTAIQFLHADGEFLTPEDLVRGTLTGRNMGWSLKEQKTAIKHVARVLRQDRGDDELGKEFGGSYNRILEGTDPLIPEDLRLPEHLRLDLKKASDLEILDRIADLMSAYMRHVAFLRDEKGDFSGSPYDAFLRKNHLPTHPEKGESDTQYAARLRQGVSRLRVPKFVDESEGSFQYHKQEFRFGPSEFRGLKMFLATHDEPEAMGVGHCATCHIPPYFTDFGFHNTGITQTRYDAMHGEGRFAALLLPSEAERQQDPARAFHPTAAHPSWQGPWRNGLSAENLQQADLGVWTILGHPDYPAVQAPLRKTLLESLVRAEDRSPHHHTITKAVGAFKTPSLRDLGHSAPYFHDGSAQTIDDAVVHYIRVSSLGRLGFMKHQAPVLGKARLGGETLRDLVAFLRSLNEDYN